MLLARAHRENGKKRRALTVLKSVIETFGVNKSVTPENGYHPGLVSLYRKTTKSIDSRRQAQLTIESTPPGATIRLNGVKHTEVTPTTIPGLFPTRYFVQLKISNRVSAVHRVNASLDNRGQRVVVDMNFEDALDVNESRVSLRFDNSAHSRSSFTGFATRLGSTLNVDYVLGVGLVNKSGKSKLVAYLVDARTGKKIKEASATANSDLITPKAIERVSTRIASAWKEGEPAQKAYKAWYQNWLGWGLVGAGVVSFGVALVYGLQYSDYRDKAVKAPTGDEQKKYSNLANDIRYNGPIAATIGALFLGGGVTVFILHAKNNPAPTAAGPLSFSLTDHLKLTPQLGVGNASLQLGLDW
jgi:hypothetical protein